MNAKKRKRVAKLSQSNWKGKGKETSAEKPYEETRKKKGGPTEIKTTTTEGRVKGKPDSRNLASNKK